MQDDVQRLLLGLLMAIALVLAASSLCWCVAEVYACDVDQPCLEW